MGVIDTGAISEGDVKVTLASETDDSADSTGTGLEQQRTAFFDYSNVPRISSLMQLVPRRMLITSFSTL